MRRWVYLAALFLALLFSLPATTATEQIKLVGPQSRAENVRKVNKLIERYNSQAKAFNDEFGKKQPADINADKASDHIAEMALTLNEVYSILTHFDEVDP